MQCKQTLQCVFLLFDPTLCQYTIIPAWHVLCRLHNVILPSFEVDLSTASLLLEEDLFGKRQGGPHHVTQLWREPREWRSWWTLQSTQNEGTDHSVRHNIGTHYSSPYHNLVSLGMCLCAHLQVVSACRSFTQVYGIPILSKPSC